MMALDKAIKSGKEHRKPYRGSKAIDATCRNHGGCPWCEENRKHKFRDKQKDDTWDDYPTCGGCQYWDGDDGRCRNPNSGRFMMETEDGCEKREGL